MESIVFKIAEVATPAMLTLLTVASFYIGKFLLNIKDLMTAMNSNIAAIRAYALELHNAHEKKILFLEIKQSEAESTLKEHHAKIEKHGESIISLETKTYSTKRK